MRKTLLLALAAIFLAAGMSKAAPPSSQDVHNLKKQQKAEWKQLKEQERASKSAMRQHPVTKEERARMKKDFKMQRQLLKRSQKEAVKNMEQSHKPLSPRAVAARH